VRTIYIISVQVECNCSWKDKWVEIVDFSNKYEKLGVKCTVLAAAKGAWTFRT